MANYISKLKWAWQAQFFSHILVILKNNVQEVLAHRGFFGEEKTRVERNPRKTRNVLVLKPQNGGK